MKIEEKAKEEIKATVLIVVIVLILAWIANSL